MTRTVFFVYTICFVPCAWGQINLSEIEKMTNDASTGYYYDTLISAFLRHPEEFDTSKGVSLYYGKIFRDSFDPYSFRSDQANFDNAMRQEQYRRAIAIGEKLLESDPVDFGLLLQLLKCYIEEKNEELATKTKMRVDVLYKAILRSGDGSTLESAIQVIQVPDEYAMMALLSIQGLSRRSETKAHSIVDIWKVRPQKRGDRKTLYFEVLRKPERKTAGQ